MPPHRQSGDHRQTQDHARRAIAPQSLCGCTFFTDIVPHSIFAHTHSAFRAIVIQS